MSQVAPQRARTLDHETPPILRAAGLRKSFRMGEETLTVLKHADLTVRHGEFVAIEGRSGSGKSTLLHLLGALDTADEGTLAFEGRDYTRHNEAGPAAWVRVIGRRWLTWLSIVLALATIGLFTAARVYSPFGLNAPTGPVMTSAGQPVDDEAAKVAHAEELAARLHTAAIATLIAFLVVFVPHVVALVIKLFHYLMRDRAAARVRNRDFGFVFQFYHLLPELNVLENTMLSPMIEFSWRGFLRRRSTLRARATEVLEQLGMAHRLRHKPNQLSGGERQRVAIARALMNNPRVLFADEPTGNLDAETGQQIMSLLERLHQEQGQTIVMVTHDRSLARRADRVLVMKDGKLERAPSPGPV